MHGGPRPAQAGTYHIAPPKVSMYTYIYKFVLLAWLLMGWHCCTVVVAFGGFVHNLTASLAVDGWGGTEILRRMRGSGRGREGGEGEGRGGLLVGCVAGSLRTYVRVRTQRRKLNRRNKTRRKVRKMQTIGFCGIARN